MAVSANSGSFVFYALKPMRKLRKEVRGPEGLRKENFRPVTEVGVGASSALRTKHPSLLTKNNRKGTYQSMRSYRRWSFCIRLMRTKIILFCF